MNRICAIVLNRNLPEVTDALCDRLRADDYPGLDVCVVEAGSDPDRLSKSCTWHADWPEAREHGLRYGRGMNFGLGQLLAEGRFSSYDYFLLLTNDTEFGQEPVIRPLMEVMRVHPRLGILSPCSKRWGERQLLRKQPTKYFWYIQNTAYCLRREFVECVMVSEPPAYMNLLFDGSNFRGYAVETELIAKAYANDWAAGITTVVWAEENESHLLTKADLIRTEGYEENMRLYVEEGRQWMRRKYGFNSRWLMQRHAKYLYDCFFEFHPEYESYRI